MTTESTNHVLYRKIEGFGWFVVGYTIAKKMGMKQYATLAGECARGHAAPMSVAKTKCIKCLAIEARNKGPELSKEDAYEYWRQKLKLPKNITVKSPRFVYVVENVPYTTIHEAERLSGIPASVIYYRSKHKDFPSYQQLPTNYRSRQQFIYKCGNSEFRTMAEAVEGTGLNSQVIMIRFHDPKWEDWKKIKVL